MTYTPETSPDRANHRLDQEPEATGWTGWIAFAGMMMVLLGSFHAFQGLLALLDDGFYAVSDNGLAVHVDYTAWGWVHLILGIIVALAGVSLFA